MDAGLLIGRAIVGLLMAAHGAQKLFGWFGGYGLTAVSGFFESLGFRPGRFFALTASGTEIAAGLLLAFGLFGPVGPALMLSVMIVAAVSAHWGSGVLGANSMELTLVYSAAAIALAVTGPGVYSLDALFGIAPMWTPEASWAALAIGVVGAAANLALRRTAPQNVAA